MRTLEPKAINFTFFGGIPDFDSNSICYRFISAKCPEVDESFKKRSNAY